MPHHHVTAEHKKQAINTRKSCRGVASVPKCCRGWPNIAVPTFFHLTPSRLRRTPPIIAGGDLRLLMPSTSITFAIGKCPSATQWIGGTFSSRVSEQCMSACRLHDCETHRTRTSLRVRRGLPSVPLPRSG